MQDFFYFQSNSKNNLYTAHHKAGQNKLPVLLLEANSLFEKFAFIMFAV